MKIEKVKFQKNGFLVNDAVFVPEASDNYDYQKIQKWIDDGGVVEPEFSLEEVKAQKIAEIKARRDANNIVPITSIQAEILDNSGSGTGENTFFVFYTNRHPTNPAADPSTILTSVVVMNQAIPYSTKHPTSDEKFTINLTPGVAQSLVAHLTNRNNNNYKISDLIEEQVKLASSVEAVEAITWDNFLS